MIPAFGKGIFQFAVYFSATKLKPFSRELRQGTQKKLNQNLVIESFLEIGFEATLSSETNVLCILKKPF